MNNTHQNELKRILYHLHEAVRILKTTHIMTKKATSSYERYIEMGWTDVQLIENELMLNNEPILGFLLMANDILIEITNTGLKIDQNKLAIIQVFKTFQRVCPFEPFENFNMYKSSYLEFIESLIIVLDFYKSSKENFLETLNSITDEEINNV